VAQVFVAPFARPYQIPTQIAKNLHDDFSNHCTFLHFFKELARLRAVTGLLIPHERSQAPGKKITL